MNCIFRFIITTAVVVDVGRTMAVLWPSYGWRGRRRP